MALIGGEVAFRCVPRLLLVLGIQKQVGRRWSHGNTLAVHVAPQVRQRVVSADVGPRAHAIRRRHRQTLVTPLHGIRVLDDDQVERVAVRIGDSSG